MFFMPMSGHNLQTFGIDMQLINRLCHKHTKTFYKEYKVTMSA